MAEAPTSRDASMQRCSAWALVVIALAALLMLGQACWFDYTCSATFDETFYLGAALQTVHDRRIDRRMAEYGAAPLPVLLCHVPVALGTEQMARPVLFAGDIRDPPLISRARMIHAVIAGLGLLTTVSIWLWQRCGWWAAAVGALLLSCSPTLLAHISVATTDALFSLGLLCTLAALVWYRQKRDSFWRMLVLCATIGVAISLKYSGVFLVPLVVGVILWDEGRNCQGSIAGNRSGYEKAHAAEGIRFLLVSKLIGSSVVTCLAITYFSFIAAWACHGFEISRPLPLLWPTGEAKAGWLRAMQGWSVPTPIAGVLAQAVHNENGHEAFFMGAHSRTGWWLYFPVALAVKSTVVEWLMVILLIYISLGRWSLTRAVSDYREEKEYHLDPTRSIWLLCIAVYCTMMLTARINIGVRYALYLYPLLILLCVDVVWPLLKRWPTCRAWLAAALAVAQVVTCLLAGPDKLSYFSPVIGGSSQGHRYLADSNLDWGQDLPRLRSEFKRRGFKRVLLTYFGTARPEAYGIDAATVGKMSEGELAEFDAVAVSVTFSQGLYTGRDDRLTSLTGSEPVMRVGNSIMIYDIHRIKTFQGQSGLP